MVASRADSAQNRAQMGVSVQGILPPRLRTGERASSIPPRASVRTAGRFDALDTLRCLAVLFMVQGHTFFIVIEDSVRPALWYRWHNYLHGYTAPAFLLGAGLAFGVTTFGNLGAHTRWGAGLRKRLWRYFSILVLGYALQMPPLNADFGNLGYDRARLFLRVDALQHIGIILLVCQLMVFVLRRRWLITAAAFGLGAAIVLLAPALSRLPLQEHLPLAVAGYLTSNTGSPFPLVPWSGFVLLGIALAGAIPRASMNRPSLRLALALAAGGLLSVGASLLLDRMAPGIFGEHNYWKVGPYFFLRRAGWIVALLGGFALFDWTVRRLGAAASGGATRHWIQLIGQNSLIVYVAHLIVLYGSPYTLGVSSYASQSLSVLQGALLVALLLGSMILLLVLWDRLDRSYTRPFFYFRRASLLALGVVVLSCHVGIGGLRAPATVPPMAVTTPTPDPTPDTDGAAITTATTATAAMVGEVSETVRAGATAAGVHP